MEFVCLFYNTSMYKCSIKLSYDEIIITLIIINFLFFTRKLETHHHLTKQPLSMFFLTLLSAPNNKDIFNVEFLQQCKIRFEPPRHSRDIVQCANCQRYGHTKNFCHLKPWCVKCTRRVNALARNALVMSGVSSAMEITLPTIRAVRTVRTSKNNLSTPSTKAIHFPSATATNTAHPAWSHLRPNRKAQYL
jgi:hypothetical protein